MTATMEKHGGYTIVGSPPQKSMESAVRLSITPSIKREAKNGSNNLRILYRNSTSPVDEVPPRTNSGHATGAPTTPVLPPTPPHAEDETQYNVNEFSSPSETTRSRSHLVTPVNQNSPPTPDLTPPRVQNARIRPFLGPRPSMTSTRAESFKTAPEDVQSDAESDVSLPIQRHDYNHSSHTLPQVRTIVNHKPSPLGQTSVPVVGDSQSKEMSPVVSPLGPIISPDNRVRARDSHLVELPFEESPTIPQDGFKVTTRSRPVTQSFSQRAASTPNEVSANPRRESGRRITSLRERLQEARSVPRSPSMDKFASIIGWNDGVQQQESNNKRWSLVSTTSTVEAFVVEQPQFAKNRGTLRHISKHDSLRSASSPLPSSNRASTQTTSESPHRLVHKKARLSNVNRYSFGSDVSRSISLSSNVPITKPEIIKVAVIPARGSSLLDSRASSRRHSTSISIISVPPHARKQSDSTSTSERKRTMSETADRGRDRYYPPQAPPHIPPRGSSLSAPTSRSTSRANSVTSEHFSVERKKAERDLRTTLERMESENLAISLNSLSVESTSIPTTHLMVTVPRTNRRQREDSLSGPSASERIASSHSDVRAHDFARNVEPYPDHIVPGTKEWADLRPASILHTPFSQPSFRSASPELNEAKAINLFPHNNHSVQLIEPLGSLEESQAVREVRFGDIGDLSALPQRFVDSPLRNPRRPPQPPRLQLFPPTPKEAVSKQSAIGGKSPANRLNSVRNRPSLAGRARTDSFGRSLLRTVSLRNAQNKKADQDLDPKENPFWRPRAFWDVHDIEPPAARQQAVLDRGVIENSLGLPSQRSAVSGPVGLMHRISERRRHRKQLAKQSSYSSLQRIRAGRKVYKIPGLGVNLQFVSLKDIQNHFTRSRQIREQEKRQNGRNERSKSFGSNAVPNNDSRFPAVMMASDTSMTVNNAFLALP